MRSYKTFVSLSVVLLHLSSSLRQPRDVEPDFAYKRKLNTMIGPVLRELVSIDHPLFNHIDNNTETTHFKWPAGFPVGNALFVYWESRASAACRNQDFVVDDSAGELLDTFPRKVNASRMNNEMIEKCKAAATAHGYPHQLANARWRLNSESIQEETKGVSEKVCKSRRWAVDPKHAVAIHIRCDDYIQAYHTEYGLLPHHYYETLIPSGTHHIVIVGEAKTVGAPNGEDAPKCTKAVWDLKEYLETQRPGMSVSLGTGSTNLIDDWCFLSKATRVILSPSSFGVSAALGNPNTVIYPAVTPVLIPTTNAQSLSKWGMSPFPSNFIIYDTRLLGGKAIAGLPWSDIRNWLRG